ncbi:MAG TPA: threonine synthase, partial [Limnobacter sp.]|nr:threonine synthase [Limnobacter sp.]
NVLDEFFKTGVYRPRKSAETYITSSPSMDISKASNFERFVYDLLGRDPKALKALWQDLARDGQFDLSQDSRFKHIESDYGFLSGCSSHQNRLDTIREVYARTGTLIDTHTADGVKVAREHLEPGVPMVILETALAVKFAETIEEATGMVPPVPKAFEGIENLPQRVVNMPISVDMVKAFIAQNTGL